VFDMMRPLSLLLCALLLASPAPAEELTGTSPPDGVRIESGQSARVEAHNVCRNVANNTGAPVMIPHRTPQEWAVGGGAFLSNPYPNLTVSPCLATTVYDVGTCAIGASGNLDQQTATACGPDYVASTGTTVNFQTGTCPAIGDARLHRIINQNAAASFWHRYLCQEAPPGRPGHVYLGEFQSTSA